MICHRIQRSIVHSPQLCIQSFVNSIQRFEISSTRDNVVYQPHRLSSRWQYHSSQHTIIQQELNNEKRALRCTQINEEFKFYNALGARNSGIFGRSSRMFPNYQSRRFFGDSAAASTAAVIGSNAPIGQYETLIRLLYDNAMIEFFQNSLVSLHSYTGLPWWADIVLVTIAARTFLTLPLALYQESNRAKVANIKVEMNDIVRQLKQETNLAVATFGWTERRARLIYNRSLKKQWNQLIIRDNCHPAKSLIVLFVQFPMWLCLSASLRNLCFMLPRPTAAARETFTQLSAEGFGWISDLTAVDSYWALPILLGVLNLANIEFRSLIRREETTRAMRIILNVSRGLTLLLVPMAGIVPSCMGLYWVTSSAYGLAQNFIVISPRVRRFVGIPKSDLECEHPYQQLCTNFKEKYVWTTKLRTDNA